MELMVTIPPLIFGRPVAQAPLHRINLNGSRIGDLVGTALRAVPISLTRALSLRERNKYRRWHAAPQGCHPERSRRISSTCVTYVAFGRWALHPVAIPFARHDIAAAALGSTTVSGVGFGVSQKQSSSKVRESETLSPTPGTVVLPENGFSRCKIRGLRGRRYGNQSQITIHFSLITG